MEFFIDQYHKGILKYVDDEDLAISLHEAAEHDATRKILVTRLAQGWSAKVEWDEDRDDGSYIVLTKGEKSQTL